MGEAVSINGRFKDEKGRYEEIKSVLIEGLSQHLRPDDSPVNWEAYFDIKDEYMELYFMTFGNYGLAMEYIEHDFISEYNDVKCEFFYLDLSLGGGEIDADKVAFDGTKIIHGFHPGPEMPLISEDWNYLVDIECPECGTSPIELCTEDELYCSECDSLFGPEEVESDTSILDLFWTLEEQNVSSYDFEVIVPTVDSYVEKNLTSESIEKSSEEEITENDPIEANSVEQCLIDIKNNMLEINEKLNFLIDKL